MGGEEICREKRLLGRVRDWTELLLSQPRPADANLSLVGEGLQAEHENPAMPRTVGD